METANLSASVDTLLHTHAVNLVSALLKSALRDPQIESSGVSHRQITQRMILMRQQPVRMSALRCLAVFPDAIRFEALQGEKSRVLRELSKALDDPLRAVRKEAVECRAKW